MVETNSLPNPSAPPQMIATPPINPPFSSKSILIILIVVFLVVLSSLVTYLLVKSQTPSQAPITLPTPVIQPSLSPSPTDETTNWNLYTDVDFQLSFKYPKNWSLDKEIIEGGAPWIPSGTKSLSFNNSFGRQAQQGFSPGFETVELSKYKSYSGEDFSYAQKEIEQLKTVFETRKVNLSQPFLLPSTNAAIAGYSPLKYLENKDGTFRGFYYFAKIAQNVTDDSVNMTRLFDLVVILTDGKEKIFQMHIAAPLGESTSEYQPLNESCFDIEKKPTCSVNKNLLSDFENIYKQIILSVESTTNK